MPDPVLEAQLTPVLTSPGLIGQQQTIVIGPELQANLSATFVTFYNASSCYSTRWNVSICLLTQRTAGDLLLF